MASRGILLTSSGHRVVMGGALNEVEAKLYVNLWGRTGETKRLEPKAISREWEYGGHS